VSHERSGEYYASVLCEVKEPEKLPETDKHIGIDLGLHDFIVCSDGERVESLKHFRKSEEKLAKRQRAFAKTVKDSKNHEKLRIKVAKCHQKIKNQRKDFLHKLSTKLINENQVISLEDLSVKGMESNHCIAKSVADASFSMFVAMLEYKAKWYGRTIVKIDRFYPSTQICSGCGFQNKAIRGMKGLKVREWTCPCCGEVHDRDLNASMNIDREGLRILNLRNAGVSSLTECHTDELVLSSDILAREATPSLDAW
jgi:putative transposase